MRALVIAVILVGGGLGWWVRSVRIQREAVEAIQRVGGYVTYDWAYKDGEIFENSGPPWPRWVVEIVGTDCFSNVTRISLENVQFDRALDSVRHFSQLEDLGVSAHKITDRDLACLEGKRRRCAIGH